MTSWPIIKLGGILEMTKDFFVIYAVSVIWLIFTVLFFFMAWREWVKSKKPLKSLGSAFFNNPNLGASATIQMIGINFESFVQELERSNQESHRIAATAYFLAGLTAAASFFLTFL